MFDHFKFKGRDSQGKLLLNKPQSVLTLNKSNQNLIQVDSAFIPFSVGDLLTFLDGGPTSDDADGYDVWEWFTEDINGGTLWPYQNLQDYKNDISNLGWNCDVYIP